MIAGLSAPSSALAAAPAAAPAGKAAPEMKAADMDCRAMNERLTGDLAKLKTEEDRVNALCDQSAESLPDQRVQNEFGQGACATTYKTINTYSKKILDQANVVCRIVDDAKALRGSCTAGQSACLRAQAQKDKAAAAELAKARKLLEEAKSHLEKRRKEIDSVAQEYKKSVDRIKKLVEEAKTQQDFDSIFLCNDLRPVLGKNADLTPWHELGRDRLLAVLESYDTGYQTAFPPEAPELKEGEPTVRRAMPASNITGLPGPANPLGEYTREIADANDRAAEALRTTRITMPRVQEYSETFENRADRLTRAADRMGGADDPKGPPQKSTITQAEDVAAGGAGVASAARRVNSSSEEGPLSGIAGASSSAPSSSAREGASSSGTRSSPASSPLRLATGKSARDTAGDAGSGDEPGAPASAADRAGDKAPGAKAAEGGGVNDLLGSFGPLGTVSIGDTDLRAQRAPPSAAAAKSGTTGASQNGTYVSGAARGSTADAAKAIAEESDPGTSLAGGLKGAPRGGAKDELDSATGKYAETTSLRDLLRKRLADRAKAGGDVGASMAAADVLEPLSGGRGPASVQDERAPAGSPAAEQTGLQAIDSEPLFSRVHHAHKRFELRHYPRAARL